MIGFIRMVNGTLDKTVGNLWYCKYTTIYVLVIDGIKIPEKNPFPSISISRLIMYYEFTIYFTVVTTTEATSSTQSTHPYGRS